MAPQQPSTAFGDVGVLPSVDEIQDDINGRFDNIFHYDKKGVRHAFVCSVCDEFLLCLQDVNFIPIQVMKKKADLISWQSVIPQNERIPTMEMYYKFEDVDNHLRDSQWLNDVALSPRGIIGRKKDSSRSPFGFSSCSQCKSSIMTGYTPFYAIVNRNFVGNAPACLQDLTEVELALITPVKGYGYCFTWAGGAQRKLKGNLTFMRIEPRKIAHAAAQLDGMGFNSNVVVIVQGKITRQQKNRASQVVRTDKILAAVEWLCQNHERWKGIDFDEMKESLKEHVPIIIDQSETVESENSNIELQEQFGCFYPDGAVHDRAGGFDDTEAFKMYVEDMQTRGFNVHLQIQLGREFVDGRDGDQLISSCLLQFPYGVGGLKEERVLKDGTNSDEARLEPFLSHLTRLSQPIFQTPMFQLIAYSLISKLRLLRKSRLQLREERKVAALANGLLSADVTSSIKGRRAGDFTAGSVASRTLLDAVDGCSRATPHSNQAAKDARRKGEALQFHFGIPSIFLTVTFDDENSLLMQVMSDCIIDDDTDVCDLSDEELAARSEKRRGLRMKFPGLGSLAFEVLLQIVLEEVVGWDMRRNCATGKRGLFGDPEAVAIAYEEQGRNTLHAHMTVWIRNFSKIREDMFFGDRMDLRDAHGLVSCYHEHVASTELIGYQRLRTQRTIFNHECLEKNKELRQGLEVANDQTLRNLRHRYAHKDSLAFAKCPHCLKTFKYEELLGMYCESIGNIKDNTARALQVVEKVRLPKSRMHAMCVEFQKKNGAPVSETPVIAINTVYNSHESCHVKGCFKCQKAGKGSSKHVCGPKCECRFRMPDRARDKAQVRMLSEENRWFEWNGVEVKQPLVEILPKRHSFDLFQNISCKAISESKFTCNSNVSVITDGPIGQYQFKYLLKPTQDEDSAAYANVEDSIKTVTCRVHEDDRKEATRLICRAAFAHSKANVIGPSLAAFLTRHDSRFYFSHKFQWCPLKDLRKVLHDAPIPGVVKISLDGSRFLENSALHYLCRPRAQENLSMKDFFEKFYVVDKCGRPKPGDTDSRFLNDTGFFQHPSAKKLRNGALGVCTQGIKERADDLLIEFSQWMFPDTAKFKHCILSCKHEDICFAMEKYAELVLLLFYPHCQLEDLQSTAGYDLFPFTLKLREVNASDHMRNALQPGSQVVFTEKNKKFLQNIQNSAYNSLRYKVGLDDLQSVTHPFSKQGLRLGEDVDVQSSEEDETEDDIAYENYVALCDGDDRDDHDATKFLFKLQQFSFKAIRNKATRRPTFQEHVPLIQVPEIDCMFGIIPYEWVVTRNSNYAAVNSVENYPDYHSHKVQDVVQVLLKKSQPSFKSVFEEINPGAKVIDANGTLRSIVDWATAAKLDAKQRRSFECLTAAFLLTFHEFTNTDFSDPSLTPTWRSYSRRAKGNLKWLLGVRGTKLVCLLHGPGGSGKSTVINLVLAYAREYCHLIGHDFTSRTIVVLAMSGVAATLVHGETAHGGMGLNKEQVSNDQNMMNAWRDSRMVIIDECSFLAGDLCNKIEKHGRDLKRDQFSPFGGLNIVYAGDFSQLEPPCQTPLYSMKRGCASFHSLLNCYIELDGRHRFKDDVSYGAIMSRFRNGFPTVEDIRFINATCLISVTRIPPPNVPVAVYRNLSRDALNCAIFEDYCEAHKANVSTDVFNGGVMVFMDDLEMQDGAKTYVRMTSNKGKAYFYSHCGEDSLKQSDKYSGRCDSVLKLYPGCPLMLTENQDVRNGQANGSRVKLKCVNVKPGEIAFNIYMKCGTTIRGFFARQILSLTVEHEVQDILPRHFEVVTHQFSFRAKIDIDGEKVTFQMRGNAFPLISNSVTTGHKLQGCTMKNLVVYEWHYSQNWVYVILSRLRTIQGLYITTPLSEDLSKYEMSPKMKSMISGFKDRLSLKEISDDDYQARLLDEDVMLSSPSNIV